MLILDTTETIASLQAFRKRHADAQRMQAQLASQPTTVDLEHYRSVLRNKAVVDEAEKILRDFKPVTYDVNAQIKAIEAFEAKAVSRCFDNLSSTVRVSYRTNAYAVHANRSQMRRRPPRRLTLSSRISRRPSLTSRRRGPSKTSL